jgi:DNA-binding SARP family transcriptional activator
VAPLLAEPVLLPTWSDPWVVAERERLRMLRIQALESVATDLAARRPTAALAAASAVIRTEPLQESAWRLVVTINLRQGNVASALRAYRTYRTMLADELEAQPTELMEALVRGLG